MDDSMTRHLLAYATWQPIPYIAGDTGIPEQTIRAWVRRDPKLEVRYFEGHMVVERRAVEQRRTMQSCTRRA